MGRYSPLEVRYKRVILKLSGEALAGQQGNGINYDVVLEICKNINIYAVFGGVLTLTAFFSRIYTADLTLSFGDGLKAVCLCLFELVFLRFILAWVRCTAFIGYRKKKLSWGRIERRKIDLK